MYICVYIYIYILIYVYLFMHIYIYICCAYCTHIADVLYEEIAKKLKIP